MDQEIKEPEDSFDALLGDIQEEQEKFKELDLDDLDFEDEEGQLEEREEQEQEQKEKEKEEEEEEEASLEAKEEEVTEKEKGQNPEEIEEKEEEIARKEKEEQGDEKKEEGEEGEEGEETQGEGEGYVSNLFGAQQERDEMDLFAKGGWEEQTEERVEGEGGGGERQGGGGERQGGGGGGERNSAHSNEGQHADVSSLFGNGPTSDQDAMWFGSQDPPKPHGEVSGERARQERQEEDVSALFGGGSQHEGEEQDVSALFGTAPSPSNSSPDPFASSSPDPFASSSPDPFASPSSHAPGPLSSPPETQYKQGEEERGKEPETYSSSQTLSDADQQQMYAQYYQYCQYYNLDPNNPEAYNAFLAYYAQPMDFASFCAYYSLDPNHSDSQSNYSAFVAYYYPSYSSSQQGTDPSQMGAATTFASYSQQQGSSVNPDTYPSAQEGFPSTQGAYPSAQEAFPSTQGQFSSQQGYHGSQYTQEGYQSPPAQQPPQFTTKYDGQESFSQAHPTDLSDFEGQRLFSIE